MNRLFALLATLVLLGACGAPVPPAQHASEGAIQSETPAASLQPATRGAGEPLRVVATTNLIGDAVQRIAGDRVTLTVLMPAGSDPHNYVAAPQDMVRLGDADVVFVNGLGLEESLIPVLRTNISAPIVSVNEAVTPLAAGTDAGEEVGHANDNGANDPHTWQDARNVALWATTIASALAHLDPENAPAYTQAGEDYAAELRALHEELAATLSVVPAAKRRLVTDHDDLGYLAHAYDFEVVGSVVPSFSTMATVSARDRSAVEQQIAAEGVKAVMVGMTVNPRLAEQLAQDVGVLVVPLYTDSLSDADGPAATYPAMMRFNAAAIANALK